MILTFADAEYLGAAARAGPTSSWSAVLESHLDRIPDLPLGPTLEAIRLCHLIHLL